MHLPINKCNPLSGLWVASVQFAIGLGLLCSRTGGDTGRGTQTVIGKVLGYSEGDARKSTALLCHAGGNSPVMGCCGLEDVFSLVWTKSCQGLEPNSAASVLQAEALPQLGQPFRPAKPPPFDRKCQLL